ncbi:glycogen phosphorylase, partial [Staphylococcus aureus]|nr:glycogen phosphorylase [Staphylococcus aureus]
PFSYASSTLSVEALKHSIAYKLMFIIGKDPAIANKHEWLNATLFAVRDRMVERWLRSNRAQLSQEVRQVYYLSMEFLLGQSLRNNLLNMNLLAEMHQVVNDLGFDLDHLLDEEPDAALGNGGLGRLAACFIDSMATLVFHPRGIASTTKFVLFAP